jgi:hypothetical protein
MLTGTISEDKQDMLIAVYQAEVNSPVYWDYENDSEPLFCSGSAELWAEHTGSPAIHPADIWRSTNSTYVVVDWDNWGYYWSTKPLPKIVNWFRGGHKDSDDDSENGDRDHLSDSDANDKDDDDDDNDNGDEDGDDDDDDNDNDDGDDDDGDDNVNIVFVDNSLPTVLPASPANEEAEVDNSFLDGGDEEGDDEEDSNEEGDKAVEDDVDVQEEDDDDDDDDDVDDDDDDDDDEDDTKFQKYVDGLQFPWFPRCFPRPYPSSSESESD